MQMKNLSPDPTAKRRPAPSFFSPGRGGGITRLAMNFPLFRGVFAFAIATAAPVVVAQSVNPRPAEHVVLVVWDGMRPDFVAPQYCPNLYALATNGVFFRKHHPAFISSTEVNGAALATGSHPGRNGILANTEYDPQISFLGSHATEGNDAIRRGDLLSGLPALRVDDPSLDHQVGEVVRDCRQAFGREPR